MPNHLANKVAERHVGIGSCDACTTIKDLYRYRSLDEAAGTDWTVDRCCSVACLNEIYDADYSVADI